MATHTCYSITATTNNKRKEKLWLNLAIPHIINCHLPNIPDDGEYKLVVATRGGLGEEFGVAIAKKSVKVEIMH